MAGTRYDAQEHLELLEGAVKLRDIFSKVWGPTELVRNDLFRAFRKEIVKENNEYCEKQPDHFGNDASSDDEKVAKNKIAELQKKLFGTDKKEEMTTASVLVQDSEQAKGAKEYIDWLRNKFALSETVRQFLCALFGISIPSFGSNKPKDDKVISDKIAAKWLEEFMKKKEIPDKLKNIFEDAKEKSSSTAHTRTEETPTSHSRGMQPPGCAPSQRSAQLGVVRGSEIPAH